MINLTAFDDVLKNLQRAIMHLSLTPAAVTASTGLTDLSERPFNECCRVKTKVGKVGRSIRGEAIAQLPIFQWACRPAGINRNQPVMKSHQLSEKRVFLVF